MLAKGPLEAEIGRLVDRVSDESRETLEAALRDAFDMGWRAHAAAVALATSDLDHPPTVVADEAQPEATKASATGVQDSVEASLSEMLRAWEAREASTRPSRETQPGIVLEIVSRHPRGLTSMEIIEAVRRGKLHITSAAVRTSLHRLKGKNLILSQSRRWYPAPMRVGNAGAAAPAQANRDGD